MEKKKYEVVMVIECEEGGQNHVAQSVCDGLEDETCVKHIKIGTISEIFKSNKEELIKELEEIKTESKEYLHEYLENDREAKEHFPTINEYNNCVDQLDNLFEARIYDLALYNLSKSLLKRLKK